jgi:hypothetical protein
MKTIFNAFIACLLIANTAFAQESEIDNDNVIVTPAPEAEEPVLQPKTVLGKGDQIQLEQGQPNGDGCMQYSQPYNDLNATVVTPRDIVCIGTACYYTPQRISATTMKRELPKSVFGEAKRTIRPSLGYIEIGRTKSEIAFWHKCQEVLDLMRTNISRLDQTVLPSTKRKVRLDVKIYHITENSYNEMSIGLGGIYSGNVPAGTPKGVIDTLMGVSSLTAAFGNLTNHVLNLKLSAAKDNNKAYELRDTSIEVSEGESFSDVLSKSIYRDASFSTPAVETAGYTIEGLVHIVDDVVPFVTLRDLSIRYGIPQKDDPKSILEVYTITDDERQLLPGIPQIVGNKTLEASGFGKKSNLPVYFEKTKFNESSRLVMFVSATILDSKQKQLDTLQELTSQEILQLPSGGDRSIDKILRSAQLDMQPVDGNSFDVIKLQLDPQLLDRANYNKKIRVLITGGGLKSAQEEVYEIQHLALNPFQFPSLYTGSSKGDISTLSLELYDKKSANKNDVTSAEIKIVPLRSMKKVDIQEIRTK